MLVREQIEHAVDLQARGYNLLRWLENAFKNGFIAPETAGKYASSDDAAFEWLDKHYLNLPDNVRPARSDLRTFSTFFATYLESTFDLDTKPGHYLYSEGAHCFCPICSSMVQAPHLKPKKVGTTEKKRAERMKRQFLRDLARTSGISVVDEALEGILKSPEWREPLGLCTYAVDLQDRLKGVTVGAASLALWRSFAWTPQGSPKHKFVLTAKAIMEAEARVLDYLSKSAQHPA